MATEPQHGRHIGDMMGCDHGPPKFHPNRSIGIRVIVFPIFCNMAAVRHLEYEFCYSGPPTKSTMRLYYRLKIWYRSDIPCRRYYDFIILPLWLENAWPRPLFGVFGGLEPLNIVGGHSNPQKAHPWVTSRHLNHKRLNSVQGFNLGGIARKKSITRTGQDKKVTKA